MIAFLRRHTLQGLPTGGGLDAIDTTSPGIAYGTRRGGPPPPLRPRRQCPWRPARRDVASRFIDRAEHGWRKSVLEQALQHRIVVILVSEDGALLVNSGIDAKAGGPLVEWAR